MQALLLQYAGLDTRVNEGWPAYEKELKRTIKNIRLIFIRMLITDFIMIQLHDLIKKQQNWPGIEL